LSTDPIPGRLRTIARVASILAAGIGLSTLIGWTGDIPVLRQPLSGAVAMNPITALLLLLGALALALTSRDGTEGFTASRVLGSLVVIGGGSRLVDSLLAGSLAPDLLLFHDQVLGLTPVPRMAYSTAICLVMIGLGLLFYRPNSPLHRLFRSIILPAVVFALLAATGYLYGATGFFDIPALDPMALNTSVALLLLCIGVAALPPPLPPVDLLVCDGVVGVTARRLLPAAFLIPFILGYFRVAGERAGVFDLGFGTAAFVVLTAVLLTVLVVQSMRYLQRTEAAQTELARAMKESEQRAFRLLEGLPTAVFVVDSAGHPYYANRKSGEILGRGSLPQAEPADLPQKYQAYLAGTNQPVPADRIQVVRALRGEESYSTDVEIHRPDRVIPLEVWATPIRDAAGRIEFAIAAFNDITERLESQRRIDQLNAELGHQVAELATVNRELETFSYSVSHDLRAPLRAVDGFSRVLETDYAGVLDQEAQRLLTRIRSNVRRMGNLIDDLLRFSRLSRKELDTRPVDMESLVTNVVADLRRSQDTPATIRIDRLPPAPGDIDLIRQVWINLIDNAVKYSTTRPDPRIEIEAVTENSEVIYSVRDNGVGFDMAYADKLFGVFQRLHRQDEFEGTGVGLAIVQRIVHRHGGRVWAESAPDQGATFHFSIPTGGMHGGH
jgi:PAS domain S-box-containing protein